MKVTKTDIKKFLSAVRYNVRGHNRKVSQLGAYIYNYRVYLFNVYEGEPENPVVKNKEYVDIVEFKEFADHKTLKELTGLDGIKLNVAVDFIYELIIKMIVRVDFKPGTAVQLLDGRIGVVEEPSETNPLYLKVKTRDDVGEPTYFKIFYKDMSRVE